MSSNLETPPHRSKKMIGFVLCLGTLTLLGIAALQSDANPALYAAIATPITTLGLGFVGGVAWMDRHVRAAVAQGAATTAIALHHQQRKGE